MTAADQPGAPTADAEGRRWVLHVDLDQFLAAVEQLRRPELRGRPVVVGGRGDPTERGVVSTASYEAREHGVRSGMPLRTAAKRCPDAVFLPVDFPTYERASAQVMATLRSLTWGGPPVLVEVLGWDEAFLGPGPGHGSLGEPERFAEAIRAEVLARTGLHCCVGIGDTKLRAKIATDFGKPRGEFGGSGWFKLTEDNWFPVMGERPTRSLWGIGTKISRRLADLGIATVAELAAADPADLAGAIGPTMGPWYRRLGRGADDSPVDPTPWTPRAHGREETFQTDLDSWDEVAAQVRRITGRVLTDIDREGRPAMRVHLKIRFRPFDTYTRVRKLPAPSNDLSTLADAAVSLLERVDREERPDGSTRPVRLLGVRLEMVPPEGGYDR